MVDFGDIYSAIYSGIPVFEMIVNGVAVMRRRNDSYMNATQILKVANIDKGKRTKILEREVLTGTHEKVQGGYGKYQGTWIPYERSLELAEKYGVRDALAPLLYFKVDDLSAPERERMEGLLTKEQTKLVKKKLAAAAAAAAAASSSNNVSSQVSPSAAHNPHSSAPQTHSTINNPSTQSNNSYATSPARKRFKPAHANYESQQHLASPQSFQRQPSPLSTQQQNHYPYSYTPQPPPLSNQHHTLNPTTTTTSSTSNDNANNNNSDTSNQRSLLMSIFLSDKPDSILPYLNGQHQKQLQQQPASNKDQPFNIDMVIDDQGNTALHWATSLARTETVKLLVGLGANIACTNYIGETPLMRGVTVVNNFDRHSFDEIFNQLKESLTVVDNKKRTALHHAAMTAGIQGRMHASVYYMKVMVDYIVSKTKPLSPKPAAETNNTEQMMTDSPPVTIDEDLKTILDAQDALGDTAYMIAAKLGCRPLMEILEEAGATPNAANVNGLQAADHNNLSADVVMEEATMPHLEQQHQHINLTEFSKRPYAPSQRGKEIMATVQRIVDALDDEYGEQLSAKEQELQRILKELESVTGELDTTRKGLEERQHQSQHLAESQQKARHIETIIQNQYKELEWLMYHYGGAAVNREGGEGRKKGDEGVAKSEKEAQSQRILPTLEEIEASVDVSEDIDQLILGDDIDNPTDQTTIEEYIKKLRATITAYKKNDEALQHEVQNLQNEYTERELQCKRLIAACCNLPLDKIDDLVEPLTLAIESDPPDLDLARVIGFMEKIRRQGAFGDPPVAASALPPISAPSSTVDNGGANSPVQTQPSPPQQQQQQQQQSHTQPQPAVESPTPNTTNTNTNIPTPIAASTATPSSTD